MRFFYTINVIILGKNMNTVLKKIYLHNQSMSLCICICT